MSTTTTIAIEFDKDVPLKEFVEALCDLGWSLDCGGKVQYWLGEKEQWLEEPISKASAVLSRLNEERLRSVIGIEALSRLEPQWNVTFNFTGTKKNVVEVVFYNGKSIVTAFPAATDFSWYVQQILPAADKMSLQPVGVSASTYY